VHAVINAVSALFTIGKQYFSEDHTLNRNQLHLDLKELFEGTEIVFHEFKRVTARFEVRHIVKSRHYCYICPKHLFLHPGPVESTKPEEPPKEDGDDPRIKPCE
jgi:tRNA U38,U39,U40 pseudouridine synthase TruA